MAEAARNLEEQLEKAPVSETAEKKTPFEQAAERGPEAVRELVEKIESKAEGDVAASTESVEEYAKEEPEIVKGIKISEADAREKLKQAAKNAKMKAGVAETAKEEIIELSPEDKDVEIIAEPTKAERDALQRRARVTLPKLVEMNRKRLDTFLSAEGVDRIEHLPEDKQEQAKTIQEAITRHETMIADAETKLRTLGVPVVPEKPEEEAPEIEGFEMKGAENLEERIGALETAIDSLESKGVRTPLEEMKLEAARAALDVATKQIEILEHQQLLRSYDGDLEELGKEWMELRKQAPANDIESFPTEIRPRAQEVWDKIKKLEQAKAGGMKELTAALAGAAALDRLRAQADANVRSLESAQARKAEVAGEKEAPAETAEARAEAAPVTEKKGFWKRAAHFMKKGAKGTGIVAGVGVAGGLLSISKVFHWIDRGLAWLQKPRSLKEMLHTIFVKPAKWLLTRPEKTFDWINYKLTGKKPTEEKE